MLDLKRVPAREQPAARRRRNFEEVCLGYGREEAMAEASRCLNCKKPRCVAGCPVSIDIPGFIAKVKAGDVAVERIIRDAMRLMGRAIGGVVNLLAPDVVVLGGGLVEAMPRLALEEVRLGLKETAMASLAQQVKVVEADLGDDATTLGAAALAADALER